MGLLINKANHFLLSIDEKEMWHIYIKDSSLVYDIYFENKFISSNKIFDKIINFNATLDSNGHPHLVCVSKEGKLIYSNYINEKWNEKFLKEFYTNSNSIDYLNIFSIKGKIHIFYSFKNLTLRHGHYPNKIYLIHLNNNNSKWKYRYLDNISEKHRDIQYFIDYNLSNKLFFFYLLKQKGKLNLSYKNLIDSSLNWSPKITIPIEPQTIKIFNIFIDSKNNVHFIYKNKDDIKNVYHTMKPIKNLSDKWENKNLIESKDIENNIYNIFEFNEKIYITWKSSDSVYIKHSLDFGKNWCEAKDINTDQVTRFKLLGKVYKDISIYKYINTFLYLNDDELNIIGIENKDSEPIIDSSDTILNDEKEGPISEGSNINNSEEKSSESEIIEHVPMYNVEKSVEKLEDYRRNHIDKLDTTSNKEDDLLENYEEDYREEISQDYKELDAYSQVQKNNYKVKINASQDITDDKNNKNNSFMEKIIDFLTSK